MAGNERAGDSDAIPINEEAPNLAAGASSLHYGVKPQSLRIHRFQELRVRLGLAQLVEEEF
ncbi:MAG TPA: hypothetical protein VFX92_02875, partial [Candidatus Krumholzibacteria bacterium]|nr:hypothetical protein [Candidatus Krumholzibacteria bacterium]